MTMNSRPSSIASANPSRASAPASKRRGVAAVELAVLAPFLTLLLFGILEVGRTIMVTQLVTNAAREGARRATVFGGGDTAAKNAVATYLTQAGISGVSASNTTVSPSANSAAGGTDITVTVSVPYASVSWLPGAAIWSSQNLRAQVVMVKQ